MSASEIISSHLSATCWFDLYPLRFRFRTCRLREFSANTLRGAFGSSLKRIDPAAYARFFTPQALFGAGPSGFADLPRPFVFRLHGPLDVGLNLFLTREPAVELFTRVTAELGELKSVEGTDLLRLPLTESHRPVHRIRLHFLTPTELKGAAVPEFGVLMARIRDRISTVRALWGSGPLEIDFKAFGERAACVRMIRCELQHVPAERTSRRTGQHHSLGGYTGVTEYEGDLAEFLPYLEAARWTGVGRQTVWGKGEIRVEEI